MSNNNLPSNCINCSQPVSGNFCSNCGQKSNVKRYTLRFILENLLSSIFNLDKGFWLTIKHLTTSPSQVIKTYLSGNTIRYFNPFKLFLFSSFVYTFIIIQFNIFDQSIEQIKSYGLYTKDAEDSQLLMLEYIKKYMSLINLINIPFYSLSTYLLFRKYKYNFTEHMIINTYTISLYTVYNIPVALFMLVVPESAGIISSLGVVLLAIISAFIMRSFYKIHLLEAIAYSIVVSFFSALFIVILIAFLMVGMLIVQN